MAYEAAAAYQRRRNGRRCWQRNNRNEKAKLEGNISKRGAGDGAYKQS